jgi:hypothetical protein
MSYMAYKRKRTSGTPKYLKRPTKKARKTRFAGRAGIQRVVSKMMNRSIETKESQERANTGTQIQNIAHNNVTVVQNLARSSALNMFTLNNGNGDPMTENTGSRIGDQIMLKGVSIKMFLENPVDRCNVYYRIMVIRGTKGEVFDRGTLFKGKSANKMMDVLNTERFSIVAQKIVTLRATNGTGGTIGLTGIPGSQTNAGTATRLVTMWIPDSKFGRGGNLQYENASASQLKFYDYRICILCYDWFGTPQDVNTVGKLNDLITTIYFKDT